MFTPQPPIEQLKATERALAAAYEARELQTVADLAAKLQAPELKALQSAQPAIDEARSSLHAGLPEHAIAVLAPAAVQFSDLLLLPVATRWWDPRSEVHKLLDLLAEHAPILSGLPQFGAICYPLIEALYETRPPVDGIEGHQAAREQLRSLKHIVAVAMGPLAPVVGSDTGALWRNRIEDAAREIIEFSVRQLALGAPQPATYFLPAIEAALLLERAGLQAGALTELYAECRDLIGTRPGAAFAAVTALHHLHGSDPAGSQQEVRNLLQRLSRCDARDGGAWRAATALCALLLDDPAEIESVLVGLALYEFNWAKSRAFELGVGGEPFSAPSDVIGSGEQPGIGDDLSSIRLEGWSCYDAAMFLRPVLRGKLTAEEFCSFAGDPQAFVRKDREVRVDPERVLRVVISSLLNPFPIGDDYSVGEFAEVLSCFEGRIVLRPTREDVSEPLALQEILLRAVIQLAGSCDTVTSEFFAEIRQSVEEGKLVVARNIWWDRYRGKKLYDQGLDGPERNQAERKAQMLGHLSSVAEEIDPAANVRLKRIMDGDRVDADRWLTVLDSRFRRLGSTSTAPGAQQSVSQFDLRIAASVLSELLLGKTDVFPWLSSVVCSVGYGIRSESFVVIVGLKGDDEVERQRLENHLRTLVPMPLMVEFADEIDLSSLTFELPEEPVEPPLLRPSQPPRLIFSVHPSVPEWLRSSPIPRLAHVSRSLKRELLGRR